MEILVDLRCLQDENYAYRGVGFHTSTLLLLGRKFLSPDTKLVGLIDPSMPDVSDEHHSLVDEFRSYYATARLGETGCFIQTSPMTHDPSRCGALVANLNVYSAAIVYDFIPLDLPKRYLPTQSAATCYAEQLAWLRGYDHYFAISESTAKLLVEVLNVDRRDVHVTGVALRKSFESIAISLANPTSIVEPNEQKLMTQSEDRLRSACAMGRAQNHASKIVISGETPYIVSVGGDDPRKNLDVLLAAHAQLSHRSRVIVIGKYTDSSIDRMYELYSQYGGRKSQLQFLKGITDDQLAELYRNAECSVCCSEMEGFSLPVLEAIACGCPTILSDNAAHRELVSDEDAFFPPGNIDALVRRLDLFLNDASRREKLFCSQSEMPKRFLAVEVTKRFWYPITKALQTRQGVQRRSVHNSFRRRNRFQKPRLAVVSPFPPDASGVADYTRKSVESIGRLVDVDVFTDSSNP
ncbi:MAG: glycosyltransferase, partial [Planctomycetes bacterium]|nr:glycosyltransferase [Planctomycetota bacterium]